MPPGTQAAVNKSCVQLEKALQSERMDITGHQGLITDSWQHTMTPDMYSIVVYRYPVELDSTR